MRWFGEKCPGLLGNPGRGNCSVKLLPWHAPTSTKLQSNVVIKMNGVVMSNVVKFPSQRPPPSPSIPPVKKTVNGKKVVKLVFGIAVRAVWTLAVITWPILKWVISLEVLWRLLLVVYHRDDPGSHAGLIFCLHFLAFSAITYFVTIYKPKDLKL